MQCAKFHRIITVAMDVAVVFNIIIIVISMDVVVVDDDVSSIIIRFLY